MLKPPRRAIFRLSIEAALRREGISRIAGVDEVGRGCWAGPVYAAAVVLPASCYRDRRLLARVVDSKLLSPSLRAHLAADILRLAVGVAVAWVEAPVIDRLNILGATRRTMYAALECLAEGPLLLDEPGTTRLAGGPVTPQFVLTDAVPLPDLAWPHRAITRADRSCLAVAAASIVAKVVRDAEMCRRQALYPHLALDRNKGYGTAAHARALYAAGLTPIHRRTFAPMKYLLGLRDHVSGALPPPPDAR
ncbi:MAG TPA: ribonuclease HII [Chloroflexota bacterium]|nr:ribonuclease HII [Chloroflexota bacterium]